MHKLNITPLIHRKEYPVWRSGRILSIRDWGNSSAGLDVVPPPPSLQNIRARFEPRSPCTLPSHLIDWPIIVTSVVWIAVTASVTLRDVCDSQYIPSKGRMNDTLERIWKKAWSWANRCTLVTRGLANQFPHNVHSCNCHGLVAASLNRGVAGSDAPLLEIK
jgi:hypothetical protein